MVNDFAYDLDKCDIVREVSNAINIDVQSILILLLPKRCRCVLLYLVGDELGRVETVLVRVCN